MVGINIECSENEILLSQSGFANQVVDHFEKKASITILMNKTTLPKWKLETSKNKLINQNWYQSIIGSLIYMPLGTRPDISFAVNYLARYSTSPQEEHWQASRHLLGYIEYSINQTMKYWITGKKLEVWTDADWGGEFQCSTTGFVFKLFGCTVAWASRRQTLVATSTCAAELVAMGMITDLLSFILQILESTKEKIPATLICDNKAAVMILEGSKTRIKSLERPFYSVNDLIRNEWISTTNQLAEVCTKRLGPTKHSCKL
ncbi:hypothetical protein O181_040816 [Austropuccinia psidii MF-1]|uniref:Reverse transcriptase Ty1/copia-type domain-containing protein n=1 Tax=Austropuccinia psidii MF-1 TaxID=1389203 RepID=A0A9Q3HDR3_9BASI|nr:hypothetical protein [Austropuccinia psidii MF-1]